MHLNKFNFPVIVQWACNKATSSWMCIYSSVKIEFRRILNTCQFWHYNFPSHAFAAILLVMTDGSGGCGVGGGDGDGVVETLDFDPFAMGRFVRSFHQIAVQPHTMFTAYPTVLSTQNLTTLLTMAKIVNGEFWFHAPEIQVISWEFKWSRQ